ncbi:EmrB/QacA subfamily drug resistance transporter [Mycobacterium sp. BK086]|nr:EmrB/QacA subfamily drug resistance transporter [Mycobacterium sp. BK086]
MTGNMAGPVPDVDLDLDPDGVLDPPANPWRALWAMLVGFFMILVDSTIVAVANPSIMDGLEITDYDTVIWVTSAYLLAYAVPLLLAGRLGDRFGPKNLYIIGLAIFTVSSLWCGLAGSIEMLISARVAQGLGAALLTPQTLSTITRIFPPERRGVAMSMWGATAGVATLVGPLAGGVLVGRLGWEWIFFVNVPVGVIGLALAVWLIPTLPTTRHRFDVVGVALSGIGMFLVVFGLQEGQGHQWQAWIWAVIVAGIGFFTAFVYWQSINPREPLIPLEMFSDRDFSLSNLGVAVIGFVVTAMMLPVMFYAQVVCGLSPTRSALLIAPMAIVSGVLAPFVGQLVDKAHPRPILGFGFSVVAIALTWLSIDMTPTTPIWRLVLPLIAMGVGMAFIWAPLATTATRNLPPHLAGAGAGVYNTTRQVGSVLGSAGIAAFMASRISDEMPAAPSDASPADLAVLSLPSFLHEPFAAALSQSMLLPAFVALFGIVAALFVLGPRFARARMDDDEITDEIPAYDEGYDDDDYVEYLVEPSYQRVPAPVPDAADEIDEIDDKTEVIVWERPEPEPEPEPNSERRKFDPLIDPIGFAHNGFHVDGESRYRPLERVAPEPGPRSRHRLTDESEPRPARHYRDEHDEVQSYGRHSRPGD